MQKARLAPGPLAHHTSPGKNLAVQAAKQPDQQNDRQWNADEPKQYPASHDILLCCLIKDCLSTTRRGGSSIVAAGIGRGLGIGPAPRGLSRRSPPLYCARRVRRGGRVAEGARLESVYTGNRIVGSNPTPSAKVLPKMLFDALWRWSKVHGLGCRHAGPLHLNLPGVGQYCSSRALFLQSSVLWVKGTIWQNQET